MQTSSGSYPATKNPNEKKNDSRLYLILGIAGLVIALLMFYLGFHIILESRLEQFDHSYVWDGYSQMDIVMLSDPFYETNDGDHLYMAIDRNMSINVVLLDPEQEASMSSIRNSSIYESGNISSLRPISVQGKHAAITDSMRHALIDAYNEMMGTESMTWGGSMKSMGAIYLDATDPPETRSPWLYLILGILVFGLSLYFIITSANQIKKKRARTGHTTKEDPRLQQYDVRVGYELQSETALTAHAVVDLRDKEKLHMIPFENILWMYSNRKKKPLGASVQSIQLGLRDGSFDEVAELPTSGAGNQIYLEIFSDIRDRIPGVLVGFSDENEQKYKEKIAELEGKDLVSAEDLDLLPEEDSKGNTLTGEWQEGEDILPEGWTPESASEMIEEELAEQKEHEQE